MPSGVAVGDFDQDGQLDFAVSNEVPVGTVTVFLARGNSFRQRGVFGTGGEFSVALTRWRF